MRGLHRFMSVCGSVCVRILVRVIRPCVLYSLWQLPLQTLGLRGLRREWALSVCGRVVQLEALIDFVIEPRMGVTAMRLVVFLCRDLVRFLLECDA